MAIYACRIRQMNPIERAVQEAGGPSKVAVVLGVSAQAVCFYRDQKRRLPVEHCTPLEAIPGVTVRRWDLRPDDWHRIWPELIGSDGAPALPQPATAGQGA